MKTNRRIYTRNFLLTLTVLATLMASCEKVEIDVSETEQEGRVVITSTNYDRGGDDEEEPIVRGVVQTGNGVAVSNATVKIFEDGNTSHSGTDTTNANGEFEITVPAGNYYFQVTLSGSTTTTNVITINNDYNVLIVI